LRANVKTMRWQTDRPVAAKVEYLPRRRPQRHWAGLVGGLVIVAIMVGVAKLAGPAAALLLHAAAVLLTVAMVAGLVAFAAFRIGVAPFLGPGRAG
jgi:hypothetical protein